MDLELLGGAAAIALAGTFVFALIAMSWRALTGPFAGRARFPGNVMSEAAQRFRDDLDKLGSQRSMFLATALVFAVVFSLAAMLRPQELFGKMPLWQIALVLSVIVVSAAHGAYRLVSVLRRYRQLSYLRDACVAVGHGLQKLATKQNRVFYDVPVPGTVIDNVVVGPRGIYAVHVIAMRPEKDNRMRLDDERLSFAPENVSLSLAGFGRKSDLLARDCKNLLNHNVNVRSVIAVPGWEIDMQDSVRFLLVNERHLPMINGWRDPQDYLMDEDVEAIEEMLSSRCARFKAA